MPNATRFLLELLSYREILCRWSCTAPIKRVIIRSLGGADRPERIQHPRSAQIQLPPCYIFAGALALAMHCHLPPGIFIQVSTQRSWASIALP